MNPEINNTLRALCCKDRPSGLSYLEIGVKDGDSLRVVLQYCKELTLLALCDTWGKEYGGSNRGNHKHIERLIKEYNYHGKVIWLDDKSQILLPTLKEKFDIVLVDGNHSHEGAKTDLINSWKLLNSNGYLLFHDIYHPKHLYLEQLWNEFTKHKGLTIRTGNGLGIIRK